MFIREATAADGAAIARVKVAVWRPTYENVVQDTTRLDLDPQEQEEHFARMLHQPDANTFLLVGCAADGRIVGYVRGGPEKTGDPLYRGEVYAIYLLPSHQRLGMGRLLLCQAAKELQKRGFPAMLLHTFVKNPARRFFEALGGHHLCVCARQIGNAPEDLVLYGWQDLEKLASL